VLPYVVEAAIQTVLSIRVKFLQLVSAVWNQVPGLSRNIWWDRRFLHVLQLSCSTWRCLPKWWKVVNKWCSSNSKADLTYIIAFVEFRTVAFVSFDTTRDIPGFRLQWRWLRWRKLHSGEFRDLYSSAVSSGRLSQGGWGGRGMWHAWERRGKCVRVWWESPKEWHLVEDRGFNGRMGSEWILGRLGVWSAISWLRIGAGGGLLWMRLWTFGFWHHGVRVSSKDFFYSGKPTLVT
jgi:hypothetical protein